MDIQVPSNRVQSTKQYNNNLPIQHTLYWNGLAARIGAFTFTSRFLICRAPR